MEELSILFVNDLLGRTSEPGGHDLLWAVIDSSCGYDGATVVTKKEILMATSVSRDLKKTKRNRIFHDARKFGKWLTNMPKLQVKLRP